MLSQFNFHFKTVIFAVADLREASLNLGAKGEMTDGGKAGMSSKTNIHTKTVAVGILVSLFSRFTVII